MQHYNILIVDEDKDDIEILCEALKKKSVINIHHLRNATEVLLYLESIENKENLPQLIITDYYLPGMNCKDFLVRLKSSQKYRNLQVIVLSTLRSKQLIEELKILGATYYFNKPFSYLEYLEIGENIKALLK